jgi:nicotinamidase-related amidase
MNDFFARINGFYETRRLSPEVKFLYHALRENRVAHISVHNQKVFPKFDTFGKIEDKRMHDFCQSELAFTQSLDGHALTINAQYDINAANKNYREVAAKTNKPFEDYHPEMRFHYDVDNFKVRPEIKEGANFEYIDLLNDNYNQHVFIDGYDNVFSDSERAEKLVKFLKENGRDVLLYTGLYSTACVPASVNGGIEKGFKTYIAPDMVFSHRKAIDKHDLDHEDLVEKFVPKECCRISSQEVLSILPRQKLKP